MMLKMPSPGACRRSVRLLTFSPLELAARFLALLLRARQVGPRTRTSARKGGLRFGMLLLGVEHLQAFLLAIHAGEQFAARVLELRLLDVVLTVGGRRDGFGLLRARLRLNPGNVGVELLHLAPLFLDRPFDRAPVELDDDVTLLHVRPVACELDDPKLPGIGWRQHDDRPAGFDFAA